MLKDKSPNFCRRLFFHMNSKARYILDLFHLANLIYIAIMIPMQIGFNVRFNGFYVFFEVVSLLVSLLVVVANMRTPVMIKGEVTLRPTAVLKYYYTQNGLLLDLFGILPLNLILGAFNVEQPHVFFIAILRSLRIISAWKSLRIFG